MSATDTSGSRRHEGPYAVQPEETGGSPGASASRPQADDRDFEEGLVEGLRRLHPKLGGLDVNLKHPIEDRRWQ